LNYFYFDDGDIYFNIVGRLGLEIGLWGSLRRHNEGG